MCGIVGYVGFREATPVLMEGLSRLEYRGYDSAGIAAVCRGELTCRKQVGRLAALEQMLVDQPVAGTVGIGHTRWATHGEPSTVNSHPHLDSRGRLAVVHNGIIENYQELKSELQQEGHVFLSQTDTEVVAHLVRRELDRGAASLPAAVRAALARTRGAYALGILSLDDPHCIIAARRGSPLIVGIGEKENFIASDVPAILHHIREAIYLRDGEMAVITASTTEVTTLEGDPVEADRRPVTLRAEAVECAGFETFMLKEIHEQPRVLRGLLDVYSDGKGALRFDNLKLAPDYFRKLSRIMIVSCGTAYHAGMLGKLLLENLTGIAVEVDLASEFRYRDPKIDPGTLVIPVSQSGETADTLASVRMARDWGCKVLSICNTEGSSLTRESDAVLFTHCGPEIGVASTKAYTAQLMVFVLLTLHVAHCRRVIDEDAVTGWLKELARLPDAIHYVISGKDHIRAIAAKHHSGPSSLYLGRKYNFPTALEGALKNKEISYQHAEGYAAGEMKHGPIALINEYLPVVCICTRTRDEVYEKMISNVKEVEARHGRIIAIATAGDKEIGQLAEDIIFVPPVPDECSPIVNVVALQLLAYYSAQARGTDIDKPRNLAKSVTVE